MSDRDPRIDTGRWRLICNNSSKEGEHGRIQLSKIDIGLGYTKTVREKMNR